MKNNHFTLQDIKDFLKEEYGLNWNGKIRKDFDKKEFVEASIEDFYPSGSFVPQFLLRRNGKRILKCIGVGNVRFVLFEEKSREKVDKSEEWKDFLAVRHNQEQGLNK